MAIQDKKRGRFAAPMKFFLSSEQTGNGSAQNVAHGIPGVTPTKVLVALTGGPATYSQPVVTQGAHNTTNVVVTVTNGWKYVVLAWA